MAGRKPIKAAPAPSDPGYQALLQVAERIAREFPPRPSPGTPYSLSDLREYLTWLETRWLPSITGSQSRPALRLIEGGRS